MFPRHAPVMQWRVSTKAKQATVHFLCLVAKTDHAMLSTAGFTAETRMASGQSVMLRRQAQRRCLAAAPWASGSSSTYLGGARAAP